MENTEKKLSGRMVKRILKIIGYKYVDFAYYLSKERSWLYHVLFHQREIPILYYDYLVEFVGKQNFDIALKKAEYQEDLLLKKYRIKR